MKAKLESAVDEACGATPAMEKSFDQSVANLQELWTRVTPYTTDYWMDATTTLSAVEDDDDHADVIPGDPPPGETTKTAETSSQHHLMEPPKPDEDWSYAASCVILIQLQRHDSPKFTNLVKYLKLWEGRTVHIIHLYAGTDGIFSIYVYVYLYIYIYIYIYIFVHIPKYIYIFLNIFICLYIQILIYTQYVYSYIFRCIVLHM